MDQKLNELRVQFELGQQQLAVLDQKRAELRDTMIRISGAIQVLEELIAQDGNSGAEPVSAERPA